MCTVLLYVLRRTKQSTVRRYCLDCDCISQYTHLAIMWLQVPIDKASHTDRNQKGPEPWMGLFKGIMEGSFAERQQKRSGLIVIDLCGDVSDVGMALLSLSAKKDGINAANTMPFGYLYLEIQEHLKAIARVP